MKQLKVVLAILVIMVLLLIPVAALADNAAESTVNDDLIWSEGINAQFAHNTWYAAGRHWMMYTYYDDVVCASTADYGVTHYEFAVTTGAQTIFRGFACWYDELIGLVHYARVEQRPGNDTDGDIIYYRAGIPNANGTITWIAEEAALESPYFTGATVGTITIACDEQGYPYIAWTEDEYSLGNLTGHFWPEVDASDSNSGTWIESEDVWNDWLNGNNHGYNALYGAGNWTAVAVNLVPIGATGDLMQLSWSIEEMNGAHTAGIDSSVYNGNETWDDCSWIVPLDAAYGLYPDTLGEIAFSAYDMGEDIHFVYTDVDGNVMYNVKAEGIDWDDIDGYGNWTLIKDVGSWALPAIAGYAANGVGEDLIVVVNTIGGLYYDTNEYGPAPFTGTWTPIYTFEPDGDFMFLHSLQYKYGADSPVGFAWEWGDLDWEGGSAGILQYWWIDADGTAAGENPLGWYEDYLASTTWISLLFKYLLNIAIALGIIIGALKFDTNWQAKLAMIMIGLALMVIVNALL